MRSPASLAAILSLTVAPALAAPQVVTDLVPTGALVQEVMGDLAEVRVLLPQGASAHHYQMRPSDAQALQGADVVIWMGPELTPWLSRASDTLSGATQLRLLEVEGVALRTGYRILFAGAVATIPREYRRLLGVRRTWLPAVAATRLVLRIAERGLGAGPRAHDMARLRLRRLDAAAGPTP